MTSKTKKLSLVRESVKALHVASKIQTGVIGPGTKGPTMPRDGSSYAGTGGVDK